MQNGTATRETCFAVFWGFFEFLNFILFIFLYSRFFLVIHFVWQFFTKLNIHLPHDPAIHLLGI